jgi:hypothetical protein
MVFEQAPTVNEIVFCLREAKAELMCVNLEELKAVRDGSYPPLLSLPYVLSLRLLSSDPLYLKNLTSCGIRQPP